MEDYRGYLCEVDGKKTFRCVGQCFYTAKLWLELPAKLAHLDCGHCSVPTFEVCAYSVRRIEKDEETAAILACVLAYEEDSE